MGAGIELGFLILSILFRIAIWVIGIAISIIKCLFYALAIAVSDFRADNKPLESGHWQINLIECVCYYTMKWIYGFYAYNRNNEIKCPGMDAFYLLKIQKGVACPTLL